MKYLSQATIIAAITFAAELMKALIPLPVPASIYGLALLFLLLKSGILKLHQIQDMGELLLDLMPLLLIPASVSFITTLDIIGGMIVPVLIVSLLGTFLVMCATGAVTQLLTRRKKGGQNHE